MKVKNKVPVHIKKEYEGCGGRTPLNCNSITRWIKWWVSLLGHFFAGDVATGNH